MKKELSVVFVLVLTLTLTACAASAGSPGSAPEGSGSAAPSPADIVQPEEPDHSHQPAQEDNVLPHEQMLYCGNTVTRVSTKPQADDEEWEVSFWGGDSVALTDLLLHLDYSGDVCRCLPEYYVDTEFGEESYGVNLSSGYVRYGGGQTELTQEQVELIRDILDRNLPD